MKVTVRERVHCVLAHCIGWGMLIYCMPLWAQWEKVLERDNFYVADLKFHEIGDSLANGTLVFAESGNAWSEIWTTRDKGESWIKSSNQFSSQFSSIVIKDNQTQWIFGGTGTLNGDNVYKTIDGGNNWASLPLVDFFNGAFYNRKSKLLFANSSNLVRKRYLSIDEGNSWLILETIPRPAFKTGFAFINDSLGIEACGNDATNNGIYNRTTDNGLSWVRTTSLDEAWQPLGIKSTGTFFLVSEITRNVLRSDDAGLTWDTIFTFPLGASSPTGCIVGDLCHLYIQTNGNGLWESTDQGKSWHKIADFDGYRDTRYYFYNNFLFVGDTPENFPVKKPGALWRYALPPHKPEILLSNSKLLAQPCKPKDTTLTFSALFSCDGDKVMLDTIYSVASPRFTITHNGFGKEIVTDSFIVHYEPTGTSFDTAEVCLRFRLKGNTFDTSIFIFGESVSPKDSLEFIPSLTRSNIPSGEVTEYRLFPSKVMRNVNLSEISFDVTLDEDLLEVVNLSIPNGLALTHSQTQQANGVVTHHIAISGTDIALDPASAILSIELLTYITDAISTPIALSNVRLNSFDPDYERCTLSATSQDTIFTLALLCGDRTLTDFMRHGRSALEITSIRPNPARDELTVEIVSDGAVTIEVYDAAGKLVQTSQGKAGVVVVPVDMLSSGSYVMRVSSGGGVVSRGFVVER